MTDLQKRPKLAVIDYGMGNLHSVVRAWEHVGAEVCIVSHPEEVQSVDALIFPGQGAMVDAMDRLQRTHFDRVIRDWIAADRPFLEYASVCKPYSSTQKKGIVPGWAYSREQCAALRLARA